MFTTAQELKFKEILYFCLEELRATKAGLYLMEPTGEYLLVTSYGFTRKDVVAPRLGKGDPMVEWVVRHRKPWFLNHPGENPDLVNVLAAGNSTKLLTAPLYYGDRLVGFLDCRDKAGRQAYVPEDLSAVARILDRFLSLIDAEEIYPKPRDSRVTNVPSGAWHMRPQGELLFPAAPAAEPQAPAAPVFPAPANAAPIVLAPSLSSPTLDLSPPPPFELPPAPAAPPPPSTAAQELVRLQQELHDLMLARQRSAPLETSREGNLTQREVAHYRLLGESYLMIPEIVAVVFSYWTKEGCQLSIGCRRPLSSDVEAGLIENLRRFMERTHAGLAGGTDMARNVAVHGDGAPGPVERSEVKGIQTSALYGSADEGEVLLFSLILTDELPQERRDTLKSLHLLARNSLVETRDVIRYRDAFRGSVNRLLEPGLKKFTSLKVHSFTVGRIARRFAQSLGWSEREIERVTLAAILHDVGMRELDYDRLYSKEKLTDDELRLLREHPSLSALLVEEIPFPYPVAPLIRHHHERFDGGGYPDGLAGEQIPLGARLIHIIEVYDAMTSRSSYRQPVSAREALDEIVREAGRQFDPDLAPKFRELMSAPAEAESRADTTGTWTRMPGSSR